MTPEEAAKEIIGVLERVRGGWQDELGDDRVVHLRGFYLCADYGNFERTGVFFTLSADGSGEELTPWAVKGYLNYALDNGLLGIKEGAD
jgi:hypothetical protein